MVTLKEIAKECNVSITTVSNILNGKKKMSEQTRQMVMKVVEEKDISPITLHRDFADRRHRR